MTTLTIEIPEDPDYSPTEYVEELLTGLLWRHEQTSLGPSQQRIVNALGKAVSAAAAVSLGTPPNLFNDMLAASRRMGRKITVRASAR